MSKTKKTNTIKKPNLLNAAKSAQSVFDGADYEFNQITKQSEYDKIYNGKPSHLDQVSIAKEYDKPELSKMQDAMDAKSFFMDEIEEKFEINQKRIVNRAMEEKRRARENIFPAIMRANSRGQNDTERKDMALALAEDFAKRENLILVGGKIFMYNGKFYCALSEEMAGTMIFQTYRKEMISHANSLQLIRTTVALLRYCVDTQIEEFPINDHIVVFENGTLEVDKGHFRKNSPLDLASSALGIKYDPKCREMPYTKGFLKTIANGDNELYQLMLQVIGYILSNDVKAKSFFYLEGVGDAGKSRFCDLVASFFPSSGPNKVARIALQDLGGKFAMGNLVNAKLNISEDLPDSPLSATTVSRIKMISDANCLEAEAKYVQATSFKPTCKLLFASNHPLRIKEHDAAFINRIVYIPFMRAIPKHKQDKDILAKMQKELPALFNHAFVAYKKLVDSGYVWTGEDRFKPEICVINSGISIDKELILRRFVENCCYFKEGCIISTSELQEAYQMFCQRSGYTPIAGDRFSRELYALLPSTVSRTKIGNRQRGFIGIDLKTKSK